MKVSVEKPGTPGELVHHGTKGMKWGHQKAEGSSGGSSSSSSGGSSRSRRALRSLGRGADNVLFEAMANAQHTQQHIAIQASKKLKKDLPSIKSQHGDYGKLRNRVKKPFSAEAKAYRADVKTSYLKHLEDTANSITNIRGTRQYTLSEKGKPNSSQYWWTVKTRSVAHADQTIQTEVTVRPIFDSEGWIVDFEVVPADMAQSAIEQILDQDGELKLANL